MDSLTLIANVRYVDEENFAEEILFCKIFNNIPIKNITSCAANGANNIQGAIQKFEYVSNCALSSGAICLKISEIPFDCLSLCHVVLNFYDIWM